MKKSGSGFREHVGAQGGSGEAVAGGRAQQGGRGFMGARVA